MKLIMLALLTLCSSVLAQETNNLISENIRLKREELVKISIEHGVDKYNYSRKYRKKFLESVSEAELVNRSTKDFYQNYLRENPTFRPARVKNISGNVVMIYKGNKIKMSYDDYLNNQFFLNQKMVKFDINNEVDRELEKIKTKYRSRGIPILTDIEQFIKLFIINDAHAFGNDNKTHYALGLSFYNLLYKIVGSSNGLMVDFFEELNEGLHLHYKQCQDSGLDEQKFSAFMAMLENYRIPSRSIASTSIRIDSCSRDLEDTFSKSPISLEQGEVIEKVCNNIKILDSCIAGLQDNNKFSTGRVPASVNAFIETQDIQVLE